MIHLLQKPLLGVPVNWSHPLARGLVGCWLMNEGGGDKIYDLSGNRNMGIFAAGSASPTWKPGKFGGTLYFGGDDYIDVSDSSSLNNISTTGAISIVVSFRATDLSGTIIRRLVSKLYTCFDFFYMCSGDTIQFDVNAAPLVGSVLTANQVYHTVATYDKNAGDNNQKIYLNGLLNAQTTETNGLVANDNVLRIGSYPTLARPHIGDIDYIYLYNRALSAAEIAQLYREPFAMFDRPSIGLLYVVPPAGGQTILDYERSHRGVARGVLVGVP